MSNCNDDHRKGKRYGGAMKKAGAAAGMKAKRGEKGINPPGQRPAPKRRPKPPTSGGMKGINPPGAKPAPKAAKRPVTSQKAAPKMAAAPKRKARPEMAKRMASRAAAMQKRFSGRGR